MAPPGSVWLRLFIKTSSYERLSGGPVDLHGAADLTLFVPVQTVESRRDTVELADVGVCRPYPAPCVTALARASVETLRSFTEMPSVIIGPKETYAPFPASYLLNPVREFPAGPGPFVVRKPVAWFTRTFEFRNIRLSDYVR
jgi:hypothetical protein